MSGHSPMYVSHSLVVIVWVLWKHQLILQLNPQLDVDFAFIFFSPLLAQVEWIHSGVRELSRSIVHACSLSRDVVACLRWKPVDMRTFSSFLLSFTAAWLSAVAVQRPVDIKNRPRIPIPDEDPYSVASNELENSGASGSSGEIGRERIAVTKEHLMQQMNGKRSEKPPKLPPRDNIYPQVRVVRVSDTPTCKRKTY